MKKHLPFAVAGVLLCAIGAFAVFAARGAWATSDIEITYNSNQHTIVSPLEKSFRFVATIKNNGSSEKNIIVENDTEAPERWHILMPEARYRLGAGEQINFVVTFEGDTDARNPQEASVTAPFEFSWEGGSETVTVTVDNTFVDPEEAGNFEEVNFKVYDKNTNEPITSYNVLTNFQSGTTQNIENCESSDGACSIAFLPGTYLTQLAEQYSMDHKYTGYLLQVAATGYKSYFESDFQPSNGDKEIYLEHLDEVGAYTLSNTIDSGFSIWWIKASADEEYFAFSQGTHGGPGVVIPDQTKIVMADASGNQLWEKAVEGECWGVNVSPDGQYVAAGCHDEKIHLWNRAGDVVWTYENERGGTARWVEFSPNSLYLMSGPVDNQPEQSALFDVATGNMIWDIYTGAYLREARFSEDGSTVYLASANGALQAVDVLTGEELWLGSGEYYIPFVLGSSAEEGLIVAAGKGRAFVAIDLETGEQLWQTTVDQTVTAGEVSEDGTVVGGTVGGMGYKLDSDGDIVWARNYGGVGHNAVYNTRNGDYALFGGPNPTLFDAGGNVLWQREPGAEIQMSGPNDIDTGAAYVSWMSEDASLLVLGGDDGKIDFYSGEVKSGTNSYSQLTGPFASGMSGEPGRDPDGEPTGSQDDDIDIADGQNIMVPVIAGGGILLLVIGGVLIYKLVKTGKDPKARPE